MTTLYTPPYDICAKGFYFEGAADYEAKAAKLVNACGQPVEELEIQFIDGDQLDFELFTALSVHQGNFTAYLEAIAVIIAAGEAGCNFNLSPLQNDTVRPSLASA